MSSFLKYEDKNQKLKRIIELLKLALYTEDQELLKFIIESVVEMLDEEIDS